MWVFVTSRLRLTDKKANVLADKREAYSGDALSRVRRSLWFAPVHCQARFLHRGPSDCGALWSLRKESRGFDVRVVVSAVTCRNLSKMQ